MRAIYRHAGAVLLAAVSSSAFAQPKADFGTLAMCDKLSRLPAGYRAIDCDKRAPLRQCSFSLPGDKLPITYFVEGGVVKSKWLTFGTQTSPIGPFGLKGGDREGAAMVKVRRGTGLAFQKWDDEEAGAGATYYQSSDITCRNNSYNLRVFFENGVLERVSVSSLPMN